MQELGNSKLALLAISVIAQNVMRELLSKFHEKLPPRGVWSLRGGGDEREEEEEEEDDRSSSTDQKVRPGVALNSAWGYYPVRFSPRFSPTIRRMSDNLQRILDLILPNTVSRTHRHDTTVHDVIRLLIPALYKNQSDSLMAADGDFHHLCKLMAPVRHRWSINVVIGGIRNTVMPSDCSPEVTDEWRKLHNAELHALYSSPDIIRNVARMGESRNAYRELVGRPEDKKPLGRPRRKWEDNIKMDLREVGYDERDWINLAQIRVRWRAYVRMAMNLRVP
ncbi:hypothetical protein ANN_10053 [Periplaneta americana]|uniref:Uncharacterized protein n=1 Tax=Periplaneta americana TaxID=6978 RepID=A0ABQ8TPH3_PERAM|nr:hypothetical protein ANN_10053 [Periplaneta americana]